MKTKTFEDYITMHDRVSEIVDEVKYDANMDYLITLDTILDEWVVGKLMEEFKHLEEPFKQLAVIGNIDITMRVARKAIEYKEQMRQELSK